VSQNILRNHENKWGKGGRKNEIRTGRKERKDRRQKFDIQKRSIKTKMKMRIF
jgi:hypothetical protein